MLLGAVIPVARSRPQLWYLARRNITLARSKVTGNTDIEYEVRYYLDLIELSLEASYITNVYAYIYIDAAIVSVLT
jgi:hypothetical protein